ncbi:hypothetical protein [Allokutzneria oryzae]|uniref:Uncharacterized protein n=1 Tax=Allokutzneria oryzae TaxID=1378989 RepID=A0ABV5ZPN2_9PSEU
MLIDEIVREGARRMLAEALSTTSPLLRNGPSQSGARGSARHHSVHNAKIGNTLATQAGTASGPATDTISRAAESAEYARHVRGGQPGVTGAHIQSVDATTFEPVLADDIGPQHTKARLERWGAAPAGSAPRSTTAVPAAASRGPARPR